jgi:hypothetical protein
MHAHPQPRRIPALRKSKLSRLSVSITPRNRKPLQGIDLQPMARGWRQAHPHPRQAPRRESGFMSIPPPEFFTPPGVKFRSESA